MTTFQSLHRHLQLSNKLDTPGTVHDADWTLLTLDTTYTGHYLHWIHCAGPIVSQMTTMLNAVIIGSDRRLFLQVESGMFCELMSKADEHGLLDNVKL